MLTAFHSTFYEEIKSILFLTSQAKRNISLYGFTKHMFCWTLALQEISGFYWTCMDIFFVGFRESLGLLRVCSENSSFRAGWNLLNFQHYYQLLSIGHPRLMKANRIFQSSSPINNAECSGSPHPLQQRWPQHTLQTLHEIKSSQVHARLKKYSPLRESDLHPI